MFISEYEYYYEYVYEDELTPQTTLAAKPAGKLPNPPATATATVNLPPSTTPVSSSNWPPVASFQPFTNLPPGVN